MKSILLIGLIAIVLIAGCTLPSFGGGTLQLKVTDQGTISSLVLSISEVKVHKASATETETEQSEGQETNETDGGGWITVVGSKNVDLIQVKGVNDLLGETSLDPGKYTQIRLSISSATAVIDGVSHTLTIPSGTLKFIHPFEIENNKTTSLILDFNADSSIVKAGDKYILKLVVRISTEFEKKEKGEAERIKNQQATEARAKRH
jgi:hypothetical protein